MLMNPDYQQPSAPSPGQFNSSQFDFIMNPNQPQKKSLLPSGPKQRLLLFVIAGAIALMFLIILFAIILGGRQTNTEQVVSLAQKQNEIVRIAAIGNTKAGGPEAQKLAALTSLTITTDQKKTTDWLSKQKTKVSSKDLAKGANSKTDAELTSAEQNGRFDEVFIKTLTAQLEDYRTSMQSTYPSLGATGKALLEQNDKNVELILSERKN